MQFSVRAARLDDAQGIIDVLNPIIAAGSYTIMSGPLSLEDQLAYMREYPPRGVFNVAVAEDDRTVLGLQSVEPFSPSEPALAHVGQIGTFISLQVRRGGIGTALMHATLEQSRAQGFLKIIATIRADNPQAIAFYTGQGFAVVGTARRHALLNGRYVDEVITEKWIG